MVIRSGRPNLDLGDLLNRNSKRSPADGTSSSSYFVGSNGAGGSGSLNINSAMSGSIGSGDNYFSGGSNNMAYGSRHNFNGATAHFDVLFGVVTGESIWRFSALDIQNGFESEQRDKIIRTYVRNAYSYHLNEIFYTVSTDLTTISIFAL